MKLDRSEAHKASLTNPTHEEQKHENGDKKEKKSFCSRIYYERFSTISQKIQWRTFLLFSLTSVCIFISRMFYAAEISSELENYGSTNQMKYRLSDFQMMTELFFDNFAFSLSQSRQTLDTISNLFNIVQARSSQYPIVSLQRCNIANVTQCTAAKKEEDIIYKMRTDVFYVYYYFLTTSIYITPTTTPAVDSTTSAQKLLISQTSFFEDFYLDLFQHFDFEKLLHHKILIVFPTQQVARIFPVKYDSNSPTTSEDYVFALSQISGTTPDWIANTMSQSFYLQSNINDLVKTTQKIIRISQPLYDTSSVPIGVVSIDILYSVLNQTFTEMLASNYETYFISADGVIIQTTVTDNKESYIFNALKGCYCQSLLNKFFQLGLLSAKSSVCSASETVSYSSQDCAYFNFRELWEVNNKYQFFLVSIYNNNYSTSSTDKLLTTIALVYFGLFLFFFAIVIYLVRKDIEEYATDITNPLRQISFKIQRIMHNIFNPKQFSKIRTDEIVIREKTEIRKFANKFGQTFHRLNEKNLFQNTVVSSLDKSYQKSKEISDKPQKDTIVDEVRNIVQSYLDDQQTNVNEFQNQERNKYSRSNNKSKHDNSFSKD